MKIGIDPGIYGAMALLTDDDHFVEVADMPIMQAGKHEQVNSAELARILRDWYGPKATYAKPTCYLEMVSAMPGQGVASMFNFGTSYGMVIGVAAALQMPLVLVRPAVWKKRAGVPGKTTDKDMARTIAQRLYPGAPLGRKKDVGRADAILIAKYGMEL